MNPDPRRTRRPNSRRLGFDATIPRIVTMALLFASAAVFEAGNLSSLSTLSNGDIWWHLRTGVWIIQNHSVPHSGLFSQSPDLAWIASSWGYDLLLAFAFRTLGLGSIPVFLMGFKSALAVVTFLLAGGLRGKFWLAAALSAIAQYILGGIQPGPIYFTILFFAVELLLLTECRRTGRVRPLFWLPALFLLWANLDIQFVYGVLLLLLFLSLSLLQEVGRRPGVAHLQHGSRANAGVVATLTLIATLVTPYSYHLGGVFFATLTSAANRYFPDFQAMTFHRSQDYILLLLTMVAFLALGLRRSRDPFQIALLVGCTMLSFQAQRNIWLATLASVAVIAEAAQARAEETTTVKAPDDQIPCRVFSAICAAALVLLTLIVSALRIPHNREALLARIGQSYPVQASNYVREHGLPQPLFNAYEWGGFLTWYLPEYPVAIDGRADLYGDDSIILYSRVMNADLPYTAYPSLTQARTLLLQRNSLMAEALSTLPRFKVAYSDRVAMVLVPQE